MGEIMVKRSRKDRLKQKFSGIEMGLADQDIKYTITSEAIEASIPQQQSDKKSLSKDEARKAAAAKSNKKSNAEISYLDFVLKAGKIIYRVLRFVYDVLSVFIFKPIIKDAIRIVNYINTAVANRKALEAQAKAGVQAQSTTIGSVQSSPIVTAIATEKTSVNTIATETKAEESEVKAAAPGITTEKMSAISAKGISAFEVDLQQIFHSKKIEVNLTGSAEDIEAAQGSLEFDSTLYEFIAFRLEQTQLLQNINNLVVNTHIDKDVTHVIHFSLKIAGQKWTHMFSRNMMPTLNNRIAAYQGSVECTHTFNATARKELCSIVIKHQRLDSFTNKEQIESTKTIEPKENKTTKELVL
jgi:hypothetical protein